MVLLGVTIDWKLNFSSHVKLLCENANKKVGALMRLRNMLSLEQKLVLLNSYAMSQFNYCSNVWMFRSKAMNEKINRTHERALSY